MWVLISIIIYSKKNLPLPTNFYSSSMRSNNRSGFDNYCWGWRHHHGVKQEQTNETSRLSWIEKLKRMCSTIIVCFIVINVFDIKCSRWFQKVHWTSKFGQNSLAMLPKIPGSGRWLLSRERRWMWGDLIKDRKSVV